MNHPEKWKYDKAYEIESYKMGVTRKEAAFSWIESLEPPGVYLDVGCGRGETLDWARERGLFARGTELVSELVDDESIFYAELENLPFDDNQFDYVSCFDVVEHLIPKNTGQALDELFRVCRGELCITTNDRPSRLPDGTDLHINKRSRDDWENDLVDRVNEIGGKIFFSTFGHLKNDWMWRIVFP